MQDILDQYGPELEEVCRVAARRAPSIEADDLTHDLLLRLYTNGHTAADIQSKGGTKYLQTAAINLMREQMRTKAREWAANLNVTDLGPELGQHLLRTKPAKAVDPEAAAIQSEQLAAFDGHCWAALGKLEGRQKSVARHYYMEGMEIPDVAELLYISLPNTHYHLRQARLSLGAEAADLTLYRTHHYSEALRPDGQFTGSEALRLALSGQEE